MKKTLIALAMALAFAGATVVPYTVAQAQESPPPQAAEKKQEKKAKKAKKSAKGKGGGTTAPEK